MRELMPEREAHPTRLSLPSHAAGNELGIWSFLAEFTNASSIGKSERLFRLEIAAPIQMQDFRIDDMYYLKAEDNAPAFARSMYPAYHFRLTARDMARFTIFFYEA